MLHAVHDSVMHNCAVMNLASGDTWQCFHATMLLTNLASIGDEDGAIWQQHCITHDSGEWHGLSLPGWSFSPEVDAVGAAGSWSLSIGLVC